MSRALGGDNEAPRPRPAGIRGSSDQVLRRQLDDLPAFRALLRSVEVELIQGAGSLRPPVLDLGCGDGHFARHALAQERPVGVDASLSELARAAVGDVEIAGLVGADAGRLPFADTSFGSVVANSVLEHIPDLDRALSEVSRVLTPGGRLVLTAPSHRFTAMLCGASPGKRGIVSRLRVRYGDWFNERSRHVHLLSLRQWQERLRALGLVPVSGHYYFPAPSLRAFHLLHYLGAPTLLLNRMTGRWIPWRSPWTRGLALRWLTPLVAAEPSAKGAYVFLVAQKGTAA